MSGTAAVDIANIALITIGEDPITSLEEPDRKAARIANERFDTIRDALLREYKWNFATKIVSIAGSPLAAPAFGFRYESPLPSGSAASALPYCLRIWRVNTTSAWAVRGRTVLSAQIPPLTIEYVYRETVVANYDPLFTELLGAHMAVLLLGTLGTMEGRKRIQALQSFLRDRRAEARRADAMEQSPDTLGDGSGGTWIQSRRVS